MKTTKVMQWTGCLAAAVVLTAWLPAGVPQQDQSAFVKRMMTLDRNRDGILSKDEVPAAMISQIAAADINQDGQWTPTELHRFNTTSGPNSKSSAKAGTNTSEQRRGRAGRGGRGNNRRADSGPGSPLDAAQILRFALTFDDDRDGGLNASELKRYADALAVRRGRARRDREGGEAKTAEGSGLQIPRSEERSPASKEKEASGLKSREGSSDDPFGSGGM